MEWLAPVAGPPAFLVPPGSLDAEIVTLSQIIAFVAYQVRVAASLALIAETP